MLSVLETAWPQGLWIVAVLFLLVYIVRTSEKRELRQDEREKNYLTIIHWFIAQSGAAGPEEDSSKDVREYVIKRKAAKP
ncbi:MAG: BhlA/UviB family holin-like peptide [Eubacteriales bacterium]|nr:BhlA/UviB family holin-like peptide [Eubacteriales bacterium]